MKLYPKAKVIRVSDLQDFVKPEKHIPFHVNAVVGKVFYPVNRYVNLKQTNPLGGDSYLIIGPYQKGTWSLVPPAYASSVKKHFCKKVVLENSSYTLCELKHFAVK